MTPRPAFLKLGGALLTDKRGREAVRDEVLARVAAEIAGWAAASSMPLLVGHGSGSFAHVAARESGFVARPTPLATARVAAAARRLDVRVVDALVAAGLPALSLPGAAVVRLSAGTVVRTRPEAIRETWAAGLLPVVYGDAVPDAEIGGAIASTEDLLVALAGDLLPIRIVLATDVDGVFDRDPGDPGARRLERISVAPPAEPAARGDDVTGAMHGKVRAMLALVARHPDIEVRIVSGLRPGAIAAALAGDPAAGGTIVAPPNPPPTSLH